MDVVGPMARTVSELAHLLAVLSGRSRSSAQPLRGMRIGVPRSYFLDDLEAAVAAGFNALLDLLRDGGAALVTIELGNVGEVAEAMAVLQNTEAAGTLAPFADDARISAGIRERIQLGRSSTATEQHQAGVVAQRWRDTVTAAFEQVRLIATPATAFVAPAAAADNLVRLSRRINRNTGCWSLLGTPVLGIPTQPAPDGLPVGVQVIAPRGADALLLSFGRDVQRRSDWHLATRRIGGGA
jgi:aspartyl-tRNA(Asn)/glutamyl-tRNA(Gln) amidotransferase subunit A